MRNNRRNTKVREGEEVLKGPEQRFPCSLWKEPQWSTLFLEGLQPMTKLMLEQRKSVQGKKQKRNNSNW